MEDFRVTQTSDEIQEILNQSPIDTADIAGLKEADATLQENIDTEEARATAAEQANTSDIAAIKEKIPDKASSENKLVDNETLQVAYYTKSAVNNLIQGLGQNDVIVGALPSTGDANTIYRVPGDGEYSDYMWFDGAWQLLATYSANTQGYQYIGIATPATNPGTPTDNVFYFAHDAGTYTNFGPLVVTQGISILKYDGASWTAEQLVGIGDEIIDNSENLAKSGDVYKAINSGIITTKEIVKETIGSSLISCGGSINGSLKWYSSTSYYGALIDVSQIDYVKILANSSIDSSYTFTKNGFSNGEDVQFATGYENICVLYAGSDILLNVPSDANYLWVYIHRSTTPKNIYPSLVSLFKNKEIDYLHSLQIDTKTRSEITPEIKNGYVSSTNGKFISNADCRTNVYKVLAGNEIYLDVKTFTEPEGVLAFAYAFWESSSGTSAIGSSSFFYRSQDKIILTVPEGAAYFAVTSVFTLSSVTYGSTDNISLYWLADNSDEINAINKEINVEASSTFSDNLPTSAIRDGFVRFNDGNFSPYSDSSIQTAFYRVDDFSDLKIVFSDFQISNANYCAFYGNDESTALTGCITYSDAMELHVPLKAKYFAIIFRYNNGEVIEHLSIMGKRKDGIKASIAKLQPLYTLFGWSDKTWLLVGDSLTEVNYRAALHYFNFVSGYTGVQFVNKGQSGKGYANGDYFYSVFNNLTDDFTFATIFGSGNDIRYEAISSLANQPNWTAALGDVDDNGTSTICGYINRAIDKFYAVAPLKKLGIITPTPWKNGSAQNVTLTDEETMMRMRTYSAKLVEIAKKRGIPCLDLFSTSGLRPWDADFRVEYYNEAGVQDPGVHPNSKGQEWISKMFLSFVLQFLL